MFLPKILLPPKSGSLPFFPSVLDATFCLWQFLALLNCLKQILSRKSWVTTPRTSSFTSGMCGQERLSLCPLTGIALQLGFQSHLDILDVKSKLGGPAPLSPEVSKGTPSWYYTHPCLSWIKEGIKPGFALILTLQWLIQADMTLR